MNTCDHGHEEIVFECDDCPLCWVLQKAEDDMDEVLQTAEETVESGLEGTAYHVKEIEYHFVQLKELFDGR